jgi:DNA-binding MurR/RpiR family transcriptional regulator
MSIRDQLAAMSDTLTQSERRLASALLHDYPFAGLKTIQELAAQANVSAASISRFVHKLDCDGYSDFQRQLIQELREGTLSPVDLHATQQLPQTGFLREYLMRISAITAQVPDVITEAQFRRVCQMLGDDKRAIYVIGGRMSDGIGQLLSRHLRQIRRNVYHLPADHEVWPEYLLRMRSKDVFVMLDFRRYQSTLEQLAAKANGRGTQILLITDQWMSPISRHSNEVLAVPIQSGSAWDTYCAAVALIEAIIAWLGDENWAATEKRIGDWDALRLNHGDTGPDA